MHIRPGAISDTEKISQIHKESIQKLCKDNYSSDDIEKWTSILNPNIYENAIKEKILIVAEEDNKICGFGILDIDNAELCAIYIQPNQIKKGIAKNILSKLEAIALEKNIRKLSLCSTINALEFYKKQGYIEDEKTFHELPNGVKLNCVKMHKTIRKPV